MKNRTNIGEDVNISINYQILEFIYRLVNIFNFRKKERTVTVFVKNVEVFFISSANSSETTRTKQVSASLQSNREKRCLKDYLNIEPTSRFKNAIMRN